MEKMKLLSVVVLLVILTLPRGGFAEERYYQYGDCEICYEYHPARPELKDKTPLVLIHGFMGSKANFYPLIQELNGEFPIFALDLLGFGESSKPKDFVYSRNNLADSVASFIETWIQRPVNLPIIAENAPGLALGMNQLVFGPAVNRGYFPKELLVII